VNLEVAKWFKQWEKCVFVKKTATEVQLKMSVSRSDLKHRPEKKVILIAGTPGIGKTTLAHVIAQHAGYDVIEVNAR
jgi:chromosome transmission fidelity protein 18